MGHAVLDLRFFVWERFAGIQGTRGLVSKTGSLSSRAFADCRLNEPEHGDNLARSVVVQPKHAQNKFCGLRRRFRRALEEGQCAGGRDVVSRETIVISFCFPETILHSGRKPVRRRFSLSF